MQGPAAAAARLTRANRAGKLAFTLGSATVRGTQVTIQYRSDATNRPVTALTFVGTRTGATVAGTFTWTRTDQTGILAWTR